MQKRTDNIYQRIGIYGIRNIVNENVYVGKTGMNFGDRWDNHKALLRSNKHFNQYLQNAWNKYGEENFVFDILCECSVDELDELERAYIEKYRSDGRSYNIADGGEGGAFLGKHLSDETKRKIGEKNRINMTGKKASAETKRKMSESHNKRYAQWTDEDRKKWGQMTSEKASGYKWSEEARAKMRGKKNGATHSVEDIKKIRYMHEKLNKTCREIADELNYTYNYVYGIITYRTWKDI